MAKKKKSEKVQAVTGLLRVKPDWSRYEYISKRMAEKHGSEWDPKHPAGDRLCWAVFIFYENLYIREEFKKSEPRWMQETWAIYFNETGRRGRPELPTFVKDFLAWVTLIMREAGHKPSGVPNLLSFVIELITGVPQEPDSIRRYIERKKLMSEEGLEYGRQVEERSYETYPR